MLNSPYLQILKLLKKKYLGAWLYCLGECQFLKKISQGKYVHIQDLGCGLENFGVLLESY